MSDFNRRMATRNRKQRFPHPDRRRNSSFIQSSPASDNEFDSNFCTPSKRTRMPFGSSSRSSTVSKAHLGDPIKTEMKEDADSPSGQPSRLDKRARDEHNEQERSRRRELAVIYELIRCSFSQDDLRHLGPGNAPKSIDKLSYPQVLQIAYQVVREEAHNLQMYDRARSDLKRVEKEFAKRGLMIPIAPMIPTAVDVYRKIVTIVDALLKLDKSARSDDGSYKTTPAQRAAHGDYQLAYLRPKHYHDSCSNLTTLAPPPQAMPSPSSSQGYSRSVRPPYSASYSVVPRLNFRLPSLSSTVSDNLPRICTVFKTSPQPQHDLDNPCDAIREDEIISRTAALEYVEEVDVPQVGSSLSLGGDSVHGTSSAEDDLYFFGDGGQCDDDDPTNDGTPIYPDMPV